MFVIHDDDLSVIFDVVHRDGNEVWLRPAQVITSQHRCLSMMCSCKRSFISNLTRISEVEWRDDAWRYARKTSTVD